MNCNDSMKAKATVQKYIKNTHCKSAVFGSVTLKDLMLGFAYVALPLNAFASSIQLNVNAGKTNIYPSMSGNPNNPNAPIQKTGPGDLISYLANYAGPITISAGRWFATSSLGVSGQTIIIANGATLSGSGPIQGIIQNSGTLTPSAGGINVSGTIIPIGTEMQIPGSYTQTSTGITRLYFAPTHGDKINFGGVVNASSGSIYVTPAPGFYDPNNAPTFTAIVWGTNSGAPSDPTVVVTTADSSQPNYLNLIVTPTVTDTGVSIRFAGVDRALNANQVTDVSALTCVTGTVNVSNGATISATANESNTIATNVSIAEGGSVNITAAAHSTINFAGAITGSNTSALNVTGSDTSSVVALSGNSSGFSGTLNASNVSLIVNGTTGAAVNAGCKGGVLTFSLCGCAHERALLAALERCAEQLLRALIFSFACMRMHNNYFPKRTR